MTEKAKLISPEILYRLNEFGRRIRLLEERVDRLISEIHSIEEELNTQKSYVKVGFERRDRKLEEIENKIQLIKERIEKLEKRIEKLATKDEIKEIKNFIDIVNPITSRFVTKDELKRIIEDFNTLKKKNI